MRVSTTNVKSEIAATLAVMKKSTKGTLGLQTFGITDLDNIGTFTSRDLKRWIIYIGFAEYKDGKVRVFFKSSIPAKGYSPRLLNDY